MTDNIHIIACGEELLSRVAFAMQEKGLSVSCSGCAPDLQTMLENGGVFVGSLQQAVSAGRKVNFVVSPALGGNPEIEYAEVLHLPVIPVSDLFTSLTENKALVVECNPRYPNRILSIIWHVLQAQKRKCDYLTESFMQGLSRKVSLSENTRICLLDGDLLLHTESRNYKSNILVLSSLLWKETPDYPTFESYLDIWHKVVNSIDRNGIVIYNQAVTVFQEWAENVREDITAIPYKAHSYRKEGDICFLTGSKTEMQLSYPCDEELLCDINAARLVCRQLGVADKSFYQMIVSADFLKK